jgi:hypothetical protein
MEHRKGAWGQMLGKAGSGRQRLPHPLHCEVWYRLLRNISTYMHVHFTFPIPDLEYMCVCVFYWRKNLTLKYSSLQLILRSVMIN